MTQFSTTGILEQEAGCPGFPGPMTDAVAGLEFSAIANTQNLYLRRLTNLGIAGVNGFTILVTFTAYNNPFNSNQRDMLWYVYESIDFRCFLKLTQNSKNIDFGIIDTVNSADQSTYLFNFDVNEPSIDWTAGVHELMFTFDSTLPSARARLYHNGVDKTSYGSTGFIENNTQVDFNRYTEYYLGRNRFQSRSMAGVMFRYGLWSSIKDLAFAQCLYDSGNYQVPPDTTDLIEWMNLNDDNPAVVREFLDESGNNNHYTAVGYSASQIVLGNKLISL